jgi:hypothetical protein
MSFLVFEGQNFYACGGWRDYHSKHTNKDAAIETAKQLVVSGTSDWGTSDWAHVVDLETLEVVKRFYKGERRNDDGSTSVVLYASDSLHSEPDGEGGWIPKPVETILEVLPEPGKAGKATR